MDINPNKIKKISVKRANGALHYKLRFNDYDYVIDDFLYQNILPYTGKIVAIKDVLDIISFSKAHDILIKLYKKVFSHTISKYDFIGRLKEKDIQDEDINRIVDKLVFESYLNDDDFINHYIERYQQDKGVNAFKRFLISKHIPSTKIEKALMNYNEDVDGAIEIAKRYVKNKVGSTRLLKEKAKIMLLTKGYTDHTTSIVLNSLTFDNENDNLKKDVIKYANKFPNDYYKIVQKLISRGYNKDDVKRALKEEGIKYEN